MPSSSPFAAEPVTRRQQLLNVAALLFAERGFYGVTIDDIGAELDMSGPALYHHLTGKEALLGEILIAISEQLLDYGSTVASAAGDPDAAQRALVAAHVDFALDRPELITVQSRDLIHASEADQHTVRRLQARYVDVWVDVGIQLHPRRTRERATAQVHATFGLINSTPHSARMERREMAEMLTAMALAALDA